MQNNSQRKDNKDIIYILYVMLGFLIMYVLRRYLMNVINGYLNSKGNTSSTEENTLSNEINKLKKEAEVFNNPQSYVKYAKLERQIIKLQRQLEGIVSEKPKEDNNISKVAYYNFAVQILFYLVNVVFIYSFRDMELVISRNYSRKNIVMDYFSKDGAVCIPLYLILIIEGFFISSVLENLEKMKKVFA